MEDELTIIFRLLKNFLSKIINVIWILSYECSIIIYHFFNVSFDFNQKFIENNTDYQEKELKLAKGKLSVKIVNKDILD